MTAREGRGRSAVAALNRSCKGPSVSCSSLTFSLLSRSSLWPTWCLSPGPPCPPMSGSEDGRSRSARAHRMPPSQRGPGDGPGLSTQRRHWPAMQCHAGTLQGRRGAIGPRCRDTCGDIGPRCSAMGTVVADSPARIHWYPVPTSAATAGCPRGPATLDPVASTTRPSSAYRSASPT